MRCLPFYPTDVKGFSGGGARGVVRDVPQISSDSAQRWSDRQNLSDFYGRASESHVRQRRQTGSDITEESC